MANIDPQMLEDNFENYPDGPWAAEKVLMEPFFLIAPIRLASVVFGEHDRLPYWYFAADARRHALMCVRNGVADSSSIAADYKVKIWEPTETIILSDGEYAAMVAGIIGGLPAGPEPNLTYGHLIRRRFGFDGEPQGIPLLSKDFDFTKEKVRRLEGKALSLIRHPPRSKFIKDYLEQKRWEFIRYLSNEVYTP